MVPPGDVENCGGMGLPSPPTNDKTTNDKKSSNNLCIVRFRPRDDWRGEYGFDWVREGEEDYGESIEAGEETKAPKDNPIDYLYAPEHVSRVVYTINRRVSDAWTCEVYYEDMGNGDVAAKNEKSEKLDHFISFPNGEKTSLKKHGNEYKAFFYEEKNISSAELNQPDRYVLRTSDEQLSLNQIIRGLINGTYSNSKYFYKYPERDDCYAVNDSDLCYFIEDEYFRKLASYKRIQYTEKHVFYDLTYRILDNTCYLLAYIIDKLSSNGKASEESRKYFLKYVNGRLMRVKFGAESWKAPNQEDRDRINEYIKDSENVASNVDMTIYSLSKSSTKKHVIVTIGYPGSIKEVTLGKEDGYKQKENKDDVNAHDQWHGKDIYSWMEEYERTFPKRNAPEKIKKEVLQGENYYGINDRGMYIVPVLSIDCDPTLHERTKFTFGELNDPPQTNPEKDGEYEIQLRIKGNCKTLKLESDNDAVVVDQTEIQNPQDKTKLKVTFCGNKPCTANIEAKAVFEDGSNSFAGALRVEAKETRFMHICLVMVRLDNADLSSDMKDAIKDNEYALRNALSAAGIVPAISKKSIDVQTSEIQQFIEEGKYNIDKTVGGKSLDDVFVEKYYALCRTNPMLLYKYVVFFFPKSFYDDTTAYADSKKLQSANGELSYVVESDNFSYNRTSVYELTHELLHCLRHPHNFQLYHAGDETKVKTTPCCFPIAQTTNIMDYEKLDYSLHRFQWGLMEQSLRVDNRKYYEKLKKYYPSIKSMKDEQIAKLESFYYKMEHTLRR